MFARQNDPDEVEVEQEEHDLAAVRQPIQEVTIVIYHLSFIIYHLSLHKTSNWYWNGQPIQVVIIVDQTVCSSLKTHHLFSGGEHGADKSAN